MAGKKFCNASVNFSPTPDILPNTKYRIYDVYPGVRTLKCIRNNVASSPMEFHTSHVRMADRKWKSSKLYFHWARWLDANLMREVWRSRNAHIDRKLEKMTSISTIESGMRWSEQHVVSWLALVGRWQQLGQFGPFGPTTRRVVFLKENYMLLLSAETESEL